MRAGDGAARQALPPFEKFQDLPGGRGSWCVGGALPPRNLIISGAWFLCREVELACARAALVSIQGSRRQADLSVTWLLPASKTDPEAPGVSRRHFCSCPIHGDVTKSCVVHAIWDQLLFLKRQFPSRWTRDKPDLDLPLFPDSRGQAVSKDSMITTFWKAAELLEVPTESVEGGTAVTGHSLRVSGAQGLARRGLELWNIQLLGRWGSDAVKRYVSDTHVDNAARSAAAAPRKLRPLE